MEIVYCGGCGRVLREDDFSRGQARFLDNRPWCAECKPPDKSPVAGTPAAGSRRQGSSAKHPRITIGTARRESAAGSPQRALIIGACLAVAAVVAAGVVLSFGGPATPVVERSVRPEPPGKPVDNAEPERLLKELESLASLAPADKILARCDELRARFKGSPQERRFLEIEAAAREQRKSRDTEGQLARDLDALRRLIDEDPRYQRSDEILRRFKSLREIAGPRAAEIERRQADYEKERRESPREKHRGPFAEDAEGFVRNWLVLGVFPNDKDKGIDTDFLKPEAAHDPVADLAVGNLKWAAHASPEAKIDFYRVAHLGIRKPKDNVVVYAACLVQAPSTVAAEFRVGSDDGAALWVDGKPVGKNHKKRALKVDEDRWAVLLDAGVHRVLVKVENHGGEFEFVLRIVSADGSPLPALKIWN